MIIHGITDEKWEKLNIQYLFYIDFLMSLKTVTECGVENSCLTNKLKELALASFDEDGVCVAQSGSWAFSQ